MRLTHEHKHVGSVGTFDLSTSSSKVSSVTVPAFWGPAQQFQPGVRVVHVSQVLQSTCIAVLKTGVARPRAYMDDPRGAGNGCMTFAVPACSLLCWQEEGARAAQTVHIM